MKILQKSKGNNAILLKEFQQLHNFGLEDGSNLSSDIDYYATTMLTHYFPFDMLG